MTISKRKIRRLIPIIILLVISFFLITKFQKNTQPKIQNENVPVEQQQTNNSISSTSSTEKSVEEKVSENILASSNKQFATLEINGTKTESELTESGTIYDFMKKARTDGKINFEEKNYAAMGAFVEEINGIKNNGEENWIYYVNNAKANIGISNYKLKPGDTVSWKFEKAN
ncbi:MAG TPA: DUF4430 domain-containing protein [Candidatus Paceibacterota bacterium]|nr:DUF4430 domain-containing protein [Candidatus Paceibacterota bacterium]